MGKSTTKKSAKGRLDKYYKLAKEQGYRARSAFKLIQLNRKYQFLTNAKFCIDLCAAPGGWLQVASKFMPQGSLIIGCDLDAIKPIPRVITFVSDITTPQCRQLIRSHAKDWKADVILHDGAPNVGKAWVQDAYTQAELVLSSLKLAVEFLRKGGTFITKVFRSKDYNSLMWVFSQLFGKAEATKPPSSRNVSAEIFVVCSDYLAPASIDPKFLDPRHVFKDLDNLPPAPTINDDAISVKSATTAKTTTTKLTLNNISILKPGKKVRHRDGYEDDATMLFKAGAASQFVLGDARTAIDFLGNVNRVDFISEEEKRWFNLKVTTEDIKANCADLKVLGRGDFQRLLKWRTAIRQDIGIEAPKGALETATETAEITPLTAEEQEHQIQEELERLTKEDAAKRKKERRKKNEKKQKEQLKVQLRMTAPTDIGMAQSDLALVGAHPTDDFFDITEAERPRGARSGESRVLAAYDNASSDSESEAPAIDEDTTLLDSEEEAELRVKRLEAEIDGMYEAYVEKRMAKDAKHRVRESRNQDKARTEVWDGIGADGNDSESDGEGDKHRGYDNMYKNRAKLGESDSENSDDQEDGTSEGEDTEKAADDEDNEPVAGPSSQRLVTSFRGLNSRPTGSKAAQVWFGQEMFKGLGDVDDLTDDEDVSNGVASSQPNMELDEEQRSVDEGDDGYEEVPADEDTGMWNVDDENEDEWKQKQIKDHGLLTAEAVTMAQKLVNRQTTKTRLINDGFNRYSFADKDGLPEWFLGEEQNYYGVSLPVTKEAVQMLRDKQRALNARPMKKIAEARARKKMRVVKRLQKAAKAAEGVGGDGDMNEKQKAEAMEKIMKKGMKKAKAKTPIQTIVARGQYRGVKGGLKGVTGRYRLVDPRMKKDLRGERRAAKAKKKRRH